tara:strand:+ start:506 stop:817 length:312 start_codon:yes stop_codon:yes gene_type:complete
MTKLNNWKTSILNTEEDRDFHLADILEAVIQASVAEGVTLGEMKIRLALVDVLGEAKEDKEFELSSKQTKVLKKVFSAHKWPMMHTDILKIAESIGVELEDDS